MTELPTAAAPSTTPEAARALAAIEASKLLAEGDLAECLDSIGDLIRITGAPDKIFEWVTLFLGRETLRQFAVQHHINLHESRASDEEQPPRAVIIWTAGGEGLAIVPADQSPAVTLLQLRKELAQRAEDEQRAADFQASTAAGHVEDVAAWHARTSRTAR